MPTAVRFLSVDDVLAMHQDTLEKEGGLAGLRDPGLLESAVMMPQQQFGGAYLHGDLAAMAAAHLFHIVANHCFHDGNNRTAALATLVFLDANGVENPPEPGALEKITLSVAAGTTGKPAMTAWMREQLAGLG